MAGEACVASGPELGKGLEWQCTAYAESWASLVKEDVGPVYGPHQPTEEEQREQEETGTCLFGVEFELVHEHPSQILGLFGAQFEGVGRELKTRPPGERRRYCLISRTHPYQDYVAGGYIAEARILGDGGRLRLDLPKECVEQVCAEEQAHGPLRVDLDQGWASVSR